MACTGGGKSEWAAVPEQFPTGMRVLVVDDDVVCLRVLEKKLQKCMYNVTSCSQATIALNILRERKGYFDVVLSDVHMPDMDGFKLLELVGLEMDLPVIMISADGRTNLVMQGIRHGACDYLIKPIRDEELKNIWQHVVRKKFNEIKEHDHSGNVEDHDRQKRANADVEYNSFANEGSVDEIPKVHKKRKDYKDEDEMEMENDDSTTAKKPRVVWSVELHQQFVSAVNQLGIDKAVPKRILEIMNFPGLTRENVASHLQKFRLYLKRLSGISQRQGGLRPYYGTIEHNPKLASLSRFDIQTLSASGQLPPQSLAALQAEFSSRSSGNLIFKATDQRALLRAFPEGSRGITVDPNMSDETEFAVWSSKNPTSTLRAANNDVLINFIQRKQAVMSESSRSINVQPSCVVVPSQHSPDFHERDNSPVSFDQSGNCRNSDMDYGHPLLRSNNSSECKRGNVFSSCWENIQDTACPQVPRSRSIINDVFDFRNLNCVQGSYNGKRDIVHGSNTSPIYTGEGTSTPNHFAVDEPEFLVSDISQVKQEPNMDLTENVKNRLFPSDDLTDCYL